MMVSRDGLVITLVAFRIILAFAWQANITGDHTTPTVVPRHQSDMDHLFKSFSSRTCGILRMPSS